MPNPDLERLRGIKTFPSLVKYLRDDLDWPIESEDFDDLTFDFEPEELGIDPKTSAKIESIKQLRPLTSSQPWGIFFIKFEPKKLPVVALRRILGQLVIKKRASANRPDQQTWRLSDLLFLSNYGDNDHRQITFAHFSGKNNSKNLPTLKVLGWDDSDTTLHMDYVHSTFRKKLRWPDDKGKNLEAWHETWSSAFTLRHREIIDTSKKLAIKLAGLAQKIRKRANSILSIETESGPLRKLMNGFKEALIHDLTEDSFADMYAQTIAYGLLSARITNPKGNNPDELYNQMPITNPFLKELMATFLSVCGRKGKSGAAVGVDFDELGINEVVDLLDNSKMEAVIRDFGDRNPLEDPVIHFYESFLKEYDPKEKVERGVFYTPRPVVSFIVRSVDEILRTEFGLTNGLADTATWSEIAKKNKELKIPEGATLNDPFVQILDPATGTGTFLVEIIDLIHKTMTEKWKNEENSDKKIAQLWNDYVPKHLLPRLYGYELLMAPYAIAHMKIGLKLHETGYDFSSDERTRIYLTNALEFPGDFQSRLVGILPALAHEAESVNNIKRNKRFTVVIGNPPYSVMSGNRSPGAVSLIESFRFLKGQRIVEKGALAHELNLQDDYIKFFGLLCKIRYSVGCGVASYISNFGFLGSRSLRGMRSTLLENYNFLRFLSLGGHRADNDYSSSEDQNVFDITQGVCISFLSKSHGKSSAACFYKRFLGNREKKYDSLLGSNVFESVTDVLTPSTPYYKLLPENNDGCAEYDDWFDLGMIMPKNSCCIITSRDSLLIDFDKDVLLEKIRTFSKLPPGDKSLEEEIGYSVKKKWDVEKSKRMLRKDGVQEERIRTILYRPFDYRFIYYEPHLLDAPARPITSMIDNTKNLVLMTPNVKTTSKFTHALISRRPGEKKCCSHDRSTQMFPLWLNSELSIEDASNLDEGFLSRFLNDKSRQKGAEEALCYIYAILFSSRYQNKYGDFLKDSFPRIPANCSINLREALIKFGSDLLDLHLFESSTLNKYITKIIGRGDLRVEKATHSDKTVWIDKENKIGFQGISEGIWNFDIGGYQVCHKWLKDRGPKKGQLGRILTKEDIAHYQKIIVAISETIRIMAEIDEVIEEHGGWPGAFVTK
jgi:hypothetical protein